MRVILPEGFFIQAVLGVVTDALHHAEAQPRLHPNPSSDAEDAFPEALGGKIGIGLLLVERPSGLLRRDMTEQVCFQFQGQRASPHNALLQADAEQGFRPHVAIEQEGVAEGGINHLSTPGRHGPWPGMPVRNWWQQRRTCHGWLFRCDRVACGRRD